MSQARPTAVPYRPLHKTSLLGMWLLLVSLVVLFAAVMLAYVLVRAVLPVEPRLGTLQMPHLLWVSTLVVIAASLTAHLALTAIRRERQAGLRRWIAVTLGLAVLFCGIQAPALYQLVRAHEADPQSYARDETTPAVTDPNRSGDRDPAYQRVGGSYGMVFALVLIHAMHVLGGVIQLIIVTIRSYRGGFDHEHYGPILHAVMYWHFLDVIWIVMFGIIFTLG